jgi:very-short-patch-repair endonuclease
MKKCYECGAILDRAVENYSINHFDGIPLCREHQKWIQKIAEKATKSAIKLYFALKERGIHDLELEKYDGYKHIDIAVVKSHINIEIDGGHHNFDKKQALSDLKRTYYSFIKGYFTLRIPNRLTEDNILDETADYIADMLEIGKEKIPMR